ncbi:MAG: SDR family NAD(P)-dependent oxidoreductase [Dehalococcoidia bacterium]|nr:SDR family NAD(P)-dependent oxidoreductase [Dehalococcoidia bacterium]
MIHEKCSLAVKVAIGIDGGRGIGRSIALGMAEDETDVVVAAHASKQIEQLAQEIHDRRCKASAQPTDIAKLEDVEGMVSHAPATFGRIDVLVNAAAICPYWPVGVACRPYPLSVMRSSAASAGSIPW